MTASGSIARIKDDRSYGFAYVKKTKSLFILGNPNIGTPCPFVIINKGQELDYLKL